MARLPQPGGDVGSWGDVLNDFLTQAHNLDGTLKDDTVAADTLASGAVTPDKLSSDTPVAGELLSYNGSDFEWITAPAAGGGGEANTASNIGTAGVGVYKQKSGVNFELKKINAGSNKITVTDDIGNNEIDIDVNTANLGLVKGDVGLGNVDNTSDINKPVSTATQTALNSKANTGVTISGATSITGGGDLTANRSLSLVNDAATPGNSRYYGTDGTGAKGFHAIPTNDPALGGNLSGTASSAQIVANAVGTTELAASSVTDAKIANGIGQSKITNLVTDLAGKANTSHVHAAADLTSGTLATARLGSGVADSSTYLRGDNTWGTPTGTGTSSPGHLTVASADSPQAIKDACDYVCTGTNDQTIINQALLKASRPNDGFGGEGHIGVCLVGPNFYIGNNNSTSITMYPSTHLYGMGPGTLLQPQFTTAGIDRGVIQLLNADTAHVFVSDLTIAKTNAVSWEGHGIKFTGQGTGDTYEIKSANDPYNRIERVWIGFARGKGMWLTGTSGGSRESQVLHCVFWNCDQQGLLIDGSSDSQVSDCRANGGDNYPRFELGGGNTKIANCKAYYSGNGTTNGDGFLVSSSRCEIANCAAQDNGRWGFRFTGTDVTATGLVADSNSRTQVDGGGFSIEADGVYEGLHAFDRNQTPASRQLRGVVFTGSQQVFLSGRMSVPSGTAEIVGSPAAGSYARVVRTSGGVYTFG